jgi:hypothetical protein
MAVFLFAVEKVSSSAFCQYDDAAVPLAIPNL